MKIYFLSRNERNNNDASSKAVNDCDYIFNKRQYTSVLAYYSNCRFKAVRMIIKGIQLLRLNLIQKESVLIIQYPHHMKRDYLNDIKRIKMRRKLKIVILIHDLESIRNLHNNEAKALKEDQKMFFLADYVIAHNDCMKKLITEKFDYEKDKIFTLQIFDYILDDSFDCTKSCKSIDAGVMVVGNLSEKKSKYLYEGDNKEVIKDFNLYGPNFSKDKLDTRRYYGVFPPEKIVSIIEGSFGLVWDGDSIDTCSGKIGEYLRYNNPHKASMYLAAGFPVIIWKQAALASFVENNNVGITVDSLREIPEKISSLSKEEYENMLVNCRLVSDKLRKGDYLNDVLNKIENVLNK